MAESLRNARSTVDVMTAPIYGDEKISLKPPAKKGGRYKLHRQVFTDQGTTTFYDDDALDWVTWKGSWHSVETLGYFESPAEARDFMIARQGTDRVA